MASQVRDHERRAGENLALSCTFASEFPDSDWIIVLRFYAALHYLQAYLTTKDSRFHAKRHDERDKAIKKSPELLRVRSFQNHYRMLRDVSEQVRYEPGFYAPSQLRNDSANWLATIRTALEGKIKRALA